MMRLRECHVLYYVRDTAGRHCKFITIATSNKLSLKLWLFNFVGDTSPSEGGELAINLRKECGVSF